MSNLKLVSIVTPFFNSKKFFDKTFESVLSQTYKKWEWIIVDDCSRKNESLFLDDISTKDKRIKVIHNNVRRGAAFSRNIAIKRAKGEFIAFLDSDDYWASTKLEKQLSFMMGHNYDFTATYFNIYDEKKECITKIVKAPTKCTHRKLLRVNYIGCLTVMYKKSILPDLYISQRITKRNDYAVWLKLSEITPCYVLKENLATYVRHYNNSVSSVGRFEMIKYHRDMFAILYGYSKFRATFCAYRNTVCYAFKELLYVSKAIENGSNDGIKINSIDINDRCIKCRFDKKIYTAKCNTPVFKAILNESDLSAYTLSSRGSKDVLSTYSRIYVGVYGVGDFVFFIREANLNQDVLSQKIRSLKEQNSKDKKDLICKVNELFSILNEFDYTFAVYKGEGEIVLQPRDFYKTKARALVILEN